MSTTSYRRTSSGEWVIVGDASLIRVGVRVSVVTKAGEIRTEAPVRVGKPFPTSRGMMRYGYLAPRSAPASKPCDECGRPGATLACTDSSGIAGIICRSCANTTRSPFERSFA